MLAQPDIIFLQQTFVPVTFRYRSNLKITWEMLQPPNAAKCSVAVCDFVMNFAIRLLTLNSSLHRDFIIRVVLVKLLHRFHIGSLSRVKIGISKAGAKLIGGGFKSVYTIILNHVITIQVHLFPRRSNICHISSQCSCLISQTYITIAIYIRHSNIIRCW